MAAAGGWAVFPSEKANPFVLFRGGTVRRVGSGLVCRWSVLPFMPRDASHHRQAEGMGGLGEAARRKASHSLVSLECRDLDEPLGGMDMHGALFLLLSLSPPCSFSMSFTLSAWSCAGCLLHEHVRKRSLWLLRSTVCACLTMKIGWGGWLPSFPSSPSTDAFFSDWNLLYARRGWG